MRAVPLRNTIYISHLEIVNGIEIDALKQDIQ